MVLVINPFSLEMSSKAGTVTEGLSLQAYCLEDSVLCCFWGCEVRALQSALQSHQHGPGLCTPELFQDALEFSYHLCQNFSLQREKKEECFTQIQPELGVNDFGFLPRDRYPLVAVLMLTNPETRDNYNIPLFMSADNSSLSGTDEPPTTSEGSGLQNIDLDENGEESESEKEWTDNPGRDCVVCQNAPINRVLLPCRHACVCDGCVCHFLHCPICRAFVQESFALSNNQTHVEDKEEDLMED
ncbi:RING finger domain protein 1 Cell growth regulatory gene 19 protein [Triplophysa tibetana]|uniref:Cell growth regulator with RING finger domain protein 1 n=1 Tax=Triplophysa tibetana TaxID=1572043 RepID=A0A5A9NFR6_9TELE|nr:RING finger domain protein 1 Cell growth regulatory gene 19 protein [Triplophysa tibetana]